MSITKGFAACEASLPAPVELVHLNERSPEVASFTDGKTPCVVGHTRHGFVMLLDAAALGACRGSVRAFEQRVREALRAPSL
jgi:hypothetical protein